ncbi:hypothetical protein ABIA31_008292 [Catenulispora sp. MAP5-51]|uniref:hypothetical protein n=1 Tax=Catenulispora sp. MAP5-51 TaxID=3156298 RepID=UPI003513162F
MTDDLATALHTMADSDQPPVMDVENVLHEGQRSLFRRRIATLGAGTAVLAASALAVGTLAGMGSGVQSGDGDGTDSAASSTYVVDPHDPVVTHFQFGYVPSGMVAYGGVDPTDVQMSTMLESESGRFQLDLVPMEAPILIDGDPRGDGPVEKVSVKVPGATTAYWLGYGKGRVVQSNGEGGEMATLALRLKSGQWMQIDANNIEDRADWKEQVLRSAAGLVRKDRSVPMPIQLAGALPQSFVFRGGSVLRKDGVTTGDLMYRLGSADKPVEDIVAINVFTTGSGKNSTVPGANSKGVCKDSKGLTVCVFSPKTDPAALTAIGGPQALLNRVTSLGTDPAAWTTDVIH